MCFSNFPYMLLVLKSIIIAHIRQRGEIAGECIWRSMVHVNIDEWWWLTWIGWHCYFYEWKLPKCQLHMQNWVTPKNKRTLSSMLEVVNGRTKWLIVIDMAFMSSMYVYKCAAWETCHRMSGLEVFCSNNPCQRLLSSPSHTRCCLIKQSSIVPTSETQFICQPCSLVWDVLNPHES